MQIQRSLLAGAFLPLSFLLTTSSASARTPTIEDRVAAQRAVEEVLWAHRIWPKENAEPKPPLSAVLSEAALRERVEDGIRKSNALETLWSRPIGAESLQAELDRMVAGSRDTRMLREMLDALGNDPERIAETLVRPALADRLLRSWYGSDARFHGALRAKAEDALARCGEPACMASMGGRYRTTTWRRKSAEDAPVSAPGILELDEAAWDAKRAEPTAGRLGALQETPAGFAVTALLAETEDELTTATVLWEKVPFDAWWASARKTIVPTAEPGAEALVLPPLDAASCVDDTWTPTRFDVPDSRRSHTTVWTGSEMIVWGGWNPVAGGTLNSGARYSPATDTWTMTSTGSNVPTQRGFHVAVWTGTKMIVWGGSSIDVSGGRYDPTTDTWLSTSTAGAPPGRDFATAVWTGSEMIMWGGGQSVGLNTGGRYNPSTDTWTATSTGTNVPGARWFHTAIWTGTEMIVWGGRNTTAYLNTGGRYNPATNAWTTTAVSPAIRSQHSAVWTGTQMVVWGGFNGTTYLQSGSRYTPSSNTWATTSVGANVPGERAQHSAVWTGTQMLIWGGTGFFTTDIGRRYNPATNTWTTMSSTGSPAARIDHGTIWTGTEMIVWGGYANFAELRTGARYNPSSDSWVPTNPGTIPSERRSHTAVWTGSEMLLFGGYGVGTEISWRYLPATDTFSQISSVGAAASRILHTAVWTGTKMIVWGGQVGSAFENTGGRYDPTTDSWAPTSIGASVPSARYYHTAVWTGSRMIVWGGNAPPVTNTGGIYDPVADAWTPTATGANVPAARFVQVAVWTGSRMIVWGGYDSVTPLSTGGVYDPVTGAWTPTSGTGAPAARIDHRAVWTGSAMVVWGGHNGTTQVNTGGRYEPASDTWTPTTLTGAPAARQYFQSVWTGAEMIVWGGGGATGDLKAGGRYDPYGDAWRPTSTGSGAPTARTFPSAVWTGTEMIVWGGGPNTASGGRYCGCALPGTVYRDADGDGYGDSAVTRGTCDGSIPAGYVADATDCDDTSGDVRPGAIEVCNGADDDCDVAIDEGIAAPSGAPELSEGKSGDVVDLAWTAIGGVTGYDVVRGSLDALRGSAGDFAASVTSCLANDAPTPEAHDTTMPGVDQGIWYLVRGVNACGGPGTYDEGSGSQVGIRDAEIAAAPGACP